MLLCVGPGVRQCMRKGFSGIGILDKRWDGVTSLVLDGDRADGREDWKGSRTPESCLNLGSSSLGWFLGLLKSQARPCPTGSKAQFKPKLSWNPQCLALLGAELLT